MIIPLRHKGKPIMSAEEQRRAMRHGAALLLRTAASLIDRDEPKVDRLILRMIVDVHNVIREQTS